MCLAQGPQHSDADEAHYLELLQPFCSAEQNHLCCIGRGYPEERFCEIILNLGQWLRRCPLKISSELSQTSCLAEWNHYAILKQGIIEAI